ncbi:hypothetical protein [Ruegeria conchae]|uniref:hypothetical protein n=1 Tax=Ruegeria conchae TaxID=981384 RepID=UPI0029C909A8|nr:hypothetical protein [Ruegeria conchae]
MKPIDRMAPRLIDRGTPSQLFRMGFRGLFGSPTDIYIRRTDLKATAGSSAKPTFKLTLFSTLTYFG